MNSTQTLSTMPVNGQGDKVTNNMGSSSPWNADMSMGSYTDASWAGFMHDLSTSGSGSATKLIGMFLYDLHLSICLGTLLYYLFFLHTNILNVSLPLIMYFQYAALLA
ncbi:hypothetical protein BT96DRAFT_536638 [Gymnopus androsaceus JB14]|uniref:Uncharacterized protein n=1 Tax=Gymnopus androsaceus JB14 TaxID=1447944 RepID=A0A6A4I1A4_9AGAR|nr:hypothetical protein BT96DRAFT_536638 [Gymnopus androsaceus JB14]